MSTASLEHPRIQPYLTPASIAETAAALGITVAQAAKLEALALVAWADMPGRSNRRRALAHLAVERTAGRIDSATYDDTCAALDMRPACQGAA